MAQAATCHFLPFHSEHLILFCMITLRKQKKETRPKKLCLSLSFKNYSPNGKITCDSLKSKV
ncbi:MAG: hypothetical protein ACTJFI_04180 [Enterococcus viikkiensis]